MKSVKYVLLAGLLSAASFASMAAQPGDVAHYHAQSAAAAGVSGSSSLISLEQQLSGKPGNGLLTPSHTTSISGPSGLPGTASSLN